MQINKTRNFAINTFFSLICQIVIFVSGLIIPRIMLETFGSEINGLTTSISQFISYFTLVEAGISSASIYALYKPLENNDTKEVNVIVKTTKVFYQKSGYIFLLLSVLFAFLYPLFIETEFLKYIEIVVLVIILSISGVIDFFTLSKYRALLTADQKTYILSIGNIIYYIVFTIIIVLAASVCNNIILVRGVALLSVLSRTVFLKYYCYRKYKYLDFSVPADNKKINKRWDALYLQLLSSVHTSAPTIIATLVTNLLSVSVYSIYNMVISGVGGMISIFTSGLYANFGHLLVDDNNENTRKVYDQFEVSFYIISTIAYSLTILLIIPFVSIYTNGITDVEYVRTILAICIVSNGFFYNLKTPQGTMIIAAGHFKETKIQTAIQGGLAIVLGTLGAIFWGLEGMMMGIIISNIYRIIDVIYYVPKKIVKSNRALSIKNVLISVSLFAFFVFISTFNFFNPKSIIEWIGIAIIEGVAVTLIVTLTYYAFRKDVVIAVIKRIKNIFTR